MNSASNSLSFSNAMMSPTAWNFAWLLLAFSTLAFCQPAWAQEEATAEATPSPATTADDEAKAAEPASADEKTEPPTEWLPTLEAAKQQAQQRRIPIVVIGSASWCGPCQLFKKEVVQAVAEAELKHWVAARIDVDDSPNDAAQLNMSSIPAIRVLSPDGRLLTSRDGFMEAAEFAEWLAETRDTATRTHEELSGSLSALKVVRLLKNLNSRESSLREATISRLADAPELAAMGIIERFPDVGLAEQLAMLDLLINWGAPVEGLDPWIPETITPERLEQLNAWGKERNFTPPTDELSVTDLLKIERLLQQLKTCDPASTVAIREQLARIGEPARPLVREQISQAADPIYLSRLTAVRYRLVATSARSAAWKDGMERLASPDFDERVNAVSELSTIADSTDEGLLLELFSDPAPLVREIALKGLTRASGTRATSALVKLLKDEDPNVRAAVLNQLAETESPAIVAPVVEYIATENDADLIVHAIRCLKTRKQSPAVRALLSLLEHDSWRVRSEAADSLATIVDESDNLRSKFRGPLKQAFGKLLDDEDSYVVGIALKNVNLIGETPEVADRLYDIIEEQPELAATAMSTFSNSFLTNNVAQKRLATFSKNSSPTIRLAAISALANSNIESFLPDIQAGLADSDSSVRSGVLDTIFKVGSTQMTAAAEEDSFVVASQTPRSPSLLQSLFGIGGASEEAESDEADKAESASPHDKQIAVQREKLKWLQKLKSASDVLHQLASAESKTERVAALRVLVLLGDESGYNGLKKLQADSSIHTRIASTFPLLTSKQRNEMLKGMLENINDRSTLVHIGEVLATISDKGIQDDIWYLLKHPACGPFMVTEMITVLIESYGTDTWELSRNETVLKKLAEALQEKLKEGSKWQRALALAVMPLIDKAKPDKTLIRDLVEKSEDPEMRHAAVTALCMMSEKGAVQEQALEFVKGDDSTLAAAALPFLAMGQAQERLIFGAIPMRSVRSTSFGMRFGYEENQPDPKPIVPRAPAELTAEMLTVHLKSEDEATAASAEYLAALLDKTQPIDRVIAFWKKNPYNEAAQKMAYRAIANGNHVKHLPDLQRIYASVAGNWSGKLADFYWTIRTMTGPGVMKLRKQIRENHTADELRPRQ